MISWRMRRTFTASKPKARASDRDKRGHRRGSCGPWNKPVIRTLHVRGPAATGELVAAIRAASWSMTTCAAHLEARGRPDRDAYAGRAGGSPDLVVAVPSDQAPYHRPHDGGGSGPPTHSLDLLAARDLIWVAIVCSYDYEMVYTHGDNEGITQADAHHGPSQSGQNVGGSSPWWPAGRGRARRSPRRSAADKLEFGAAGLCPSRWR